MENLYTETVGNGEYTISNTICVLFVNYKIKISVTFLCSGQTLANMHFNFLPLVLLMVLIGPLGTNFSEI